MDQRKRVELFNACALLFGLLIDVIAEGLTGFGIAHQIGSISGGRSGEMCGTTLFVTAQIAAVEIEIESNQRFLNPNSSGALDHLRCALRVVLAEAMDPVALSIGSLHSPRSPSKDPGDAAG